MVALLAAEAASVTHGRAAAADHPTSCAVADENAEIVFDCAGDLISGVDFASFGQPRGKCGKNGEANSLQIDSSCHYAQTLTALEDRCLGTATCLFTVTSAAFGGGPHCSHGARMKLAAVLACGEGSSSAAAGTRGLGIGWQFNIFVLTLFILYFGMGIAYNVQRNGAKGVEAIPHLAMWKDLPFLVRDGVIFAIDTIKSKGRPGYDGL